MTSDEDYSYNMKIIAPNKIYNFQILSFVIWDG